MNVQSVLRECALDLLDTEPNVTVERVVACAFAQHESVFMAERDRMVNQYARRIVASLMRELTDNEDDQPTLPGLGLPSAVCVRSDDGTYYVRADKATWCELLAGREVRVENVSAAQAKLDRYDLALSRLRPLMEDDAEMTAGRALRLIRTS